MTRVERETTQRARKLTRGEGEERYYRNEAEREKYRSDVKVSCSGDAECGQLKENQRGRKLIRIDRVLTRATLDIEPWYHLQECPVFGLAVVCFAMSCVLLVALLLLRPDGPACCGAGFSIRSTAKGAL